MSILHCKTIDDRGQLEVSETALGRGGEGSVFTVTRHSLKTLPDSNELVAKIYHNPEEGDRFSKIKAMLESPPESSSVAWPKGYLVDKNGFFKGYVMERLSIEKYRTWAELSHAKERKANSPEFDVQYALTACLNLALAIESVHNAGHCVGDINESNILVGSDAKIMIVDTDSAQITTPDHSKTFRCLVGKPEYTAAELSGISFKDKDRTFESDVFAYSVAIYQMITGGAHPSDASFSNDGEPPSVTDKIKKDIYPGINTNLPKYISTVPRIPVEAIPLVFKNIFKKSLSSNPSDRPDLSRIISSISKVVENLEQCNKVPEHWFDSREKKCPWCAWASKSTSPDPWNPNFKKKAPKEQRALPAVSFKKPDENIKIKRAPIGAAPSNRQSHQQPLNNRLSPSNSPSQSYPQQTNAQGIPPGFPLGNNNSNRFAPKTTQPQPQPQPQKSSIPKKIKGKTVLHYQDGSYGPRPPYSQLFNANPKMAFKSLANETPHPLKFWKSDERLRPRKIFVFISFLISLIGPTVYAFLASGTIKIQGKIVTEYFFTNEIIGQIFYYLLSAGSLVGLLAVLILFIHQLSSTRKKNIPLENPLRTISQGLSVSILITPFFIIGVTVGAVVIGMNMLVDLLRPEYKKN